MFGVCVWFVVVVMKKKKLVSKSYPFRGNFDLRLRTMESYASVCVCVCVFI